MSKNYSMAGYLFILIISILLLKEMRQLLTLLFIFILLNHSLDAANAPIQQILPGFFKGKQASQAEVINETVKKLLNDIPKKFHSRTFAIYRFQAQTDLKSTQENLLTQQTLAALVRQKVKTIDRTDLTPLLREKELSQQGISNTLANEQENKVGMIISGSVFQMAGQYTLLIKATETQTGQVVATAEATLPTRESLTSKGRHEHDGFFFNTTLGLGYQRSIANEINALGDVILSGASTYFAVKIGFNIYRNLLLHLDLSSNFMSSPSIKPEKNISIIGTENIQALSLLNVGVGATWYFMPANYFITGSVGDASAFYRDLTDSLTINYGFGFQLGVGKEWFFSDNWGIGIVSGFSYSHLKFHNANYAIKTDQGTISLNDFSIDNLVLFIACSATYN